VNTYRDLQILVKRTHDRVMKPSWIADIKEKNGLPVRLRGNRTGPRIEPCPDKWRPVIEDAMRKLGWIPLVSLNGFLRQENLDGAAPPRPNSNSPEGGGFDQYRL
jgi:hypothetical protein